MALQLPVTNSNSDIGDVSFSAAYARVLFGRTFKDNLVITVDFHVDEAARLAGKNAFQQRHYEAAAVEVSALALAGDHPHAPMYRWLKQQPDFTGAVDV